MKMKKILAALLVAACLLTLAACGSSGAGTVPPAGQTGGNNGGNNGGDNTNDFPKFKTANTSEVVLTAENGSTITVAPASYANDYVEFRVAFKNAAEETMMLDLALYAINGVMLDGYLNFDVEAGATETDMFGASADELRVKGIFQIATVDLMFNIMDDEWTVAETLSCQLKSNAADSFEADPQAYFKAVTSQKAQTQLRYTVKDSVDERADLGNNVYLESKVFIKNEYQEELLLEVVNEDDEMRYVQIKAETVNGMLAEGGSESYTILPGAKAILSLDMNWALPETMREAFGVEEISKMTLATTVYACDADGSMDWTDEGEYQMMQYEIPGTSATPDMSGLVIYEENGLKITAKAPVEDVFSDDYKETYVYLIFENVGDMDLYIRENDEKEIIVETEENSYVYFQNPYYLYVGDRAICYVEVDNMTGNSIFLPLTAEDNEDSSNRWEVDLNIQF